MATYARWQRTITDGSGNVVPSVNLEVKRYTAGMPPAQLYSDRGGENTIGNPIQADTAGFVGFFVRGGAYRIRAYDGNGFERVWEYVGIGTLQEMDLATLLEQATGLSWQGAWVTATEYSASHGVENDGSAYICTADHTSGATNEPGVGANWQDFWDLLASKGDTGATGATGATGSTGAQGPQGDPGEVPSARTITAGAGLTGGGDLSANRTLDVGAGTGIVANANDVAIDKASDANVRSAASNKVLTSDLVESASAGVALSDAAPVAIDWDAGINFTLTVTANRQIDNPTNGQPGTWRTILVQGNDGTDRTITFGNQYLGEVPTITDCDSGKWYLLMIYCVSSSHFVVSAKVAKS